MPIDVEIKKDEPLYRKVLIKVDFIENRGETVLNFLSNIHFLLINWLQLNQFIFIVESQQKRIVNKV